MRVVNNVDLGHPSQQGERRQTVGAKLEMLILMGSTPPKTTHHHHHIKAPPDAGTLPQKISTVFKRYDEMKMFSFIT